MRLETSRNRLLLLLIPAIFAGCDQFTSRNLGGPGSVRTKLGGPATIPQEMQDRGFLGVRLAADSGSGVESVIVAVIPGAAAELAGIQAGDVILKVDERATIKERDEFYALAKNWKPSQVLSLELTRNGQTVQYKVRLMSFDEYLPLMEATGE